MTEILGGLSHNGKLVIIGASDEPNVESTARNITDNRTRSYDGWPAGTSIDSQDTLFVLVILMSGVRSMIMNVIPIAVSNQ